MAYPYEYYTQRVAKASDYLHYWFVNADGQENVYNILTQSKNMLLQTQIQRLNAKKMAVYNALKGNETEEQAAKELGEIFDASVYQTKLNEILKENNIESLTQFSAYNMDDLQKVLDNIYQYDPQKMVDRLGDFIDDVTYIIENQFAPARNKEAAELLKKELLLEYAQNAGLTKATSLKNFTAKQQAETSRHILKNTLSKSQENLFQPTDFQKDGKLTTVIKKLLDIVAALDNFNGGESEIGIKRTPIAHSNSSNITGYTKDENEVLYEVSQKVYQMSKWLRSQTAEIVFAEEVLEANNKFFTEKFKADETIGFQSGGKSYDVSCTVSGNETMERLLDQIHKAQSILEKQVSKSDATLTITKNGVSANVGFSIKSGKQVEINSAGTGARISLQGGTPLSTLLWREAALTNDQMQSVIQLLVGHDDEGPQVMLDGIWNGVKQQIIDMSLIGVLGGSTLEGQAYFMVVQDKILPIEAILTDILMDNSSLYKLSANVMDKTIGSLDRHDYVQNNKWIEPRKSSIQSALLRSDLTWQSISALLDNTKLHISLNVMDLKHFVSLK